MPTYMYIHNNDLLRSYYLKQIDFWLEPRIGRVVDINVPPFYRDYVIGLLNSVGMPPETIQNDLQK